MDILFVVPNLGSF